VGLNLHARRAKPLRGCMANRLGLLSQPVSSLTDPLPARQPRIRGLLDRLGLWDRCNENFAKLSRGMKQKAAIARALLHQAKLVFLDEPSAGPDPVAAVTLREDIEDLARVEGTTVFLTTHNLTEAEEMCAAVGAIHWGWLITVGTPAGLRARTGKLTAEIYGQGFSDGALVALRSRPHVRSMPVHDDHLQVELRPGVRSARRRTAPRMAVSHSAPCTADAPCHPLQRRARRTAPAGRSRIESSPFGRLQSSRQAAG